jgi:hypothetical protein
MRKFIPFLLASAGLFAVLGVLFVLIRTDAVPARVRTLHWRIGETTPEATPPEAPGA